MNDDIETWEPAGGWDALNLDPKGKFVSPAVYRYAAWARAEVERLRDRSQWVEAKTLFENERLRQEAENADVRFDFEHAEVERLREEKDFYRDAYVAADKQRNELVIERSGVAHELKAYEDSDLVSLAHTYETACMNHEAEISALKVRLSKAVNQLVATELLLTEAENRLAERKD